MPTVLTSSDKAISQVWHLKGFDLFDGLDPLALHRLELEAQLVTLKRGEDLYAPGHPSEQIFALRSGLIRIGAMSVDGREGTLALLEPGEVFGELEAIEGSSRAHFASARERSLLYAIRRPAFLELMKQHGDFAFRVSVRLGRRVQEYQSKIGCLLFKGAESRLSELLLEFGQRYGEWTRDGLRLRYRFSHRELASLIGVARETVSYTLSNFRRAGLIETNGGRIVLLKPDSLQDRV